MKLLSLLLFTYCCYVFANNELNYQYQHTPVGDVLAHCQHKVPSGSRLQKLADGSLLVQAPNQADYIIPKCDTKNGTYPVIKRNKYSSFSSSSSSLTTNQVKVGDDYDGWEGYTAFYYADGFDSFLGDFSVPDAPPESPDVLYLFTGLQNIDWIPKVDPDPAGPFDIIQPVLQYPGDEGLYWSVKSWYVTLDVGTVNSDEVQVNVGDYIFGNMTRTGPQTWYIGSVVGSSGANTYISVTHERLASQPWAYNTLECYGCESCQTYPQHAPCNFTKLELYSGSKLIQPTWKVNPKPSHDMKCHEKPVVLSPDAVSIYFNKPTSDDE